MLLNPLAETEAIKGALTAVWAIRVDQNNRLTEVVHSFLCAAEYRVELATKSEVEPGV